jgi:hypothetical protein
MHSSSLGCCNAPLGPRVGLQDTVQASANVTVPCGVVHVLCNLHVGPSVGRLVPVVPVVSSHLGGHGALEGWDSQPTAPLRSLQGCCKRCCVFT